MKVKFLKNVFNRGEIQFAKDTLVDLDKPDADKHVRRGNARAATKEDEPSAAKKPETGKKGKKAE